MSTIIRTKPAAVKSSRPARRPFGMGVLASMPSYRLDCTIEDLAWWEAESRREEERLIDRLADEAAAMDRLERGLEPW